MNSPLRGTEGLPGDALAVVRRHGQQIWLQGPRRFALSSEELAALVSEGTVSGFVFDMDVVDAALVDGADYAAARERARSSGWAPDRLLEDVLLEDAAAAAALLQKWRPGDASTRSWVAVDLPPHVGLAGEATAVWAGRLAEVTEGATALVKLPGTRAGLQAAENVIAAGYGIYLHHLFTVEQVRSALAAYLRGLRLALAAGRDLSRAAAVAAVNLLRIDVAVDQLLHDCMRRSEDDRDLLESLLGRAALGTARVAADTVREFTEDAEWVRLQGKGAVPPLLAWEGTRTSSPARREMEYLEELIGPGTASVVSWSALAALRDFGKPSPRLGRGIDEAREVLDDIAGAGIDLEAVADDLQKAAAGSDERRFGRLLNTVAAGSARAQFDVAAGGLEQELRESLRELEKAAVGRRLWSRDASLWSTDDTDAPAIRNRLGWLALPETMREEALPLAAIARSRAGAKEGMALLLGMGGSSLGADALRIAFECRNLTVVDTTAPGGIAAAAGRLQVDRSVFVVSSKSGGTAETDALEKFFFDQVSAVRDDAGSRFFAVTDPGTPLHELARNRGYARVWLAPPDVGGRYSVLSVFGLLPAALMGIDVGRLLASAHRMAVLCGPEVPAHLNSAVVIGALMAVGARHGRDKLTFLTPPRLAGLGDWAEQLIAESSGKRGQGIVPVSREPLGDADRYGEDRLFVHFRVAGEEARANDELADEMQRRGHPVVRIVLTDVMDIGAELFRWEMATAVACAAMHVNAFDEPDVRDAKERAGALLQQYREEGRLGEPQPDFEEGSLAVMAPSTYEGLRQRLQPGSGLESWLSAHLRGARPPDYVGILAFLAPDLQTWHALQGLRALLRDRLGVATTLGWGPRYLHSTGQLHKGGGDGGVFLQLTADAASDLAIPGESYSFEVLLRAQALGDFQALAARGRRLLRVHLGREVETGLARLLEATRKALED